MVAKFFVLVGPSGAGKNTIQDKILAEHPDFYMPTGMWTRPYREGELPDSVRVSKEEFERQLADDTLTGVANVHGNLYGTPRQQIVAALARGRSVLRILSVVGVDHVLADTNFTKDQIVTIYLDVPIPVLIERLKLRGDAPQDITRRMETALFEQKRAHGFDYHVNANDTVEAVASKVLDIIAQELAEPVLPEPYTHVRPNPDGTTAIFLYASEATKTDLRLVNEVYTSKPDPEETEPYLGDAGDENDFSEPEVRIDIVPECNDARWEIFDHFCQVGLQVTGLEFLRAHADGTLHHMWYGTLPRVSLDHLVRIMPRYHVSMTSLEAVA